MMSHNEFPNYYNYQLENNFNNHFFSVSIEDSVGAKL